METSHTVDTILLYTVIKLRQFLEASSEKENDT